MKKIIFSLLFAVVSMGAFAQFEKGTKYVNATLTGFGLDYCDTGGFHIGIKAGGGYFIADSWMLQSQVGWDHQDGANNFDIGFGARYYMARNGFFFSGGLKYGAINPGGDAEVSRNIYLTPDVGYCFYLNDHISIEPAVFCDLSLNHIASFTKVGLKVSFGYYF